MGDKLHVADDKSHGARAIDLDWLSGFLSAEAKRMARELVEKEHRGPGDKIKAAAGRIAKKHRLDPNIILQGWNREPREMLVSRWMSLFIAHTQAFSAAVDDRAADAYEEQRSRVDVARHPALVRLADLVAGRTAQGQENEEAAVKRRG